MCRVSYTSEKGGSQCASYRAEQLHVDLERVIQAPEDASAKKEYKGSEGGLTSAFLEP
jgi:hypothetical protein